jgi:hypothetical protein
MNAHLETEPTVHSSTGTSEPRRRDVLAAVCEALNRDKEPERPWTAAELAEIAAAMPPAGTRTASDLAVVCVTRGIAARHQRECHATKGKVARMHQHALLPRP